MIQGKGITPDFGVTPLELAKLGRSEGRHAIACVNYSSFAVPMSPVATEGAPSGAGVAVAPGGASAGGLAELASWSGFLRSGQKSASMFCADCRIPEERNRR